MADTFTPVLNMVKPEINSSLNTWGQKLNADLDLLDQHAGTLNNFMTNNDARINQLIAAAIPRGCIIAWSGGAGSIPAGWLLCNGANGTPNLTDRFILGNTGNRANWEAGGSFGGGSTDTQGWHSHGGAVVATAITQAQMPSHQHGGGTDGAGDHTHNILLSIAGHTAPGGAGAPGASAQYYTTESAGFHGHNFTTDVRGGDQAHTHGINADGSHSHNVTHVPPYFSLAYIMRA